jgi:tetratricopeptide (TPR) repeat protein
MAQILKRITPKNKINFKAQFVGLLFNIKYNKMKNLVVGISLLVATTAFAQKDELKTLKKLYYKEQLSAEDFAKYKETLLKLESVATTEEDKVASNYYKAMSPLAEMSTMGATPNPMMIQKIFTPEAFTGMVSTMRTTLDYETKTGKKVFTNDINENITSMKPIFTQMALAYNNSKKYKEASRVFYNTYQLDPKDVSNLENAGITALQASEFVDAEKYYREIKAIGFKGTGKFQSKEAEVLKTIAALSSTNNNNEQAKIDFKEAIAVNPQDTQLEIDQANLYYKLNDITTYKKLITDVIAKDPNNAQLQYNVGYLTLADDGKIVDEINANLKNRAKYDELMAKRKAMYSAALPYFERAHQLDATNEDTKTILRLTYETLGMKDKAAAVK